MTPEELKAKNPDLYEKAFNMGKQEGEQKGIEKERARAVAWLDLYDYAPEDVAIGIDEGRKMDFGEALEADIEELKNSIM